MTSVTVSGNFASAYWSGSGYQWLNVGSLTTGGESYNNYNLSFAGITDLYLKKPNEIAGVAAGSRFQSMTLTFNAEHDPSSGTSSIRWVGVIGDDFNVNVGYKSFVVASGYTSHEFSGDASYWGMSGYHPADILTALRNGNLELKYDASPNATSGTCRIKNVTVEITYEPVDGTRASLIIPIP